MILMNHTDCGAYGGREAFESNEIECQRHDDDLRKAKEMILSRFPDLKIKMILAKISPLGQIGFETLCSI